MEINITVQPKPKMVVVIFIVDHRMIDGCSVAQVTGGTVPPGF
jgi:hypothetical protein